MSALQLLKRFLRRKSNPIDLLKRLCPHASDFRTMIHVGAHEAQERDFYEAHGFRDILWIEASPRVYERLEQVIAEQNRKHERSADPARHRAVNALLTDKDGDEVELIVKAIHVLPVKS